MTKGSPLLRGAAFYFKMITNFNSKNNMKQYLLIAASLLFFAGCRESKDEGQLKTINHVDFSHVKIIDNFWSPRLKNHVTATQPVCIDQIENKTPRIRNFEYVVTKEGKHSGIYFDDSDVYKALEGIGYSLINNPDPELEKKADEWIDKIEAAQQPDGYINTYYTLNFPDKRWTNMERHEMYCAGHMIEAGVAYYQATGKRKLLDVCIRMADHMIDRFGPGKAHWVPGHEEIELALVKLYQVTSEQKYLDFAYWLLEERGHGYGSMGDEGTWNPVYFQDVKPVREQTKISGHAVRSMYLYCGMTDVAVLKNDTGYIHALNCLWDDIVLRNMYITGGIGSSRHNEGFTKDYDLPNLEAYCETCASIGMVLWNHRMNLITGDSKYVDVLERSLYNGVLAGISLTGDRFFYVNPLESKGTHHRQEWYGCACCPSNVTRFIPSIGNYIYATSKNSIWVNLFIGSTADVTIDGKKVTLKQETGYPWNGSVVFTVTGDKKQKQDIRMRIPGWCKAYTMKINGTEVKPAVENGYAVISEWKSGDKISLDMDMPVMVEAADPNVEADRGKRAIQRGPLVYCMEEVDNPEKFDEKVIAPSTTFNSKFTGLLGGVEVINAETDGQPIMLIPYYAWDNREAGKMKVWIDYKE